MSQKTFVARGAQIDTMLAVIADADGIAHGCRARICLALFAGPRIAPDRFQVTLAGEDCAKLAKVLGRAQDDVFPDDDTSADLHLHIGGCLGAVKRSAPTDDLPMAA